MEKMAVWASILIIYGLSTGTAMHSAAHGSNHKLPLDMAENSVDDMYNGCEKQMKDKVKTYLDNEKNSNQDFKQAWSDAEQYYNEKWKPKPKKKHPTPLQKEQIMAIYVYTINKPQIYLDFNKACRSERYHYTTKFRYHALHFYLTNALQILKQEKKECNTSYRRVDAYFSTEVLNKEIRFGSFTSSSWGDYPSPEKFGNKSCFNITTCYGADISRYSRVGELEREVLIPPYEVFKVIEIQKMESGDPCKVVYTLRSTSTCSNLNCALFTKQNMQN
uniref:NAD(P)(+)--arginine ADP-ribosyltransferase n=1 Tax=Monopterus albus TaxID=43700 RepID=A0A3Q3JAX9_MONAL|nr:ecto-ADP-ribosyltransferase 5-like [Monopterus albus]